MVNRYWCKECSGEKVIESPVRSRILFDAEKGALALIYSMDGAAQGTSLKNGSNEGFQMIPSRKPIIYRDLSIYVRIS